MAIRILNAESVRSALSMRDAIQAVRLAYIACSQGRGAAPERVMLELPGERNVALFMPGLMDATDGQSPSLVVKAVTVFPANPARGLPMNQGALLALDAETGSAVGLLDTATVTEIRTAAGSAAATDCLAMPDSDSLGILGTGVLAPAHIEAILAVREINRIQIWGRTESNATRVAEWSRTKYPDVQVNVASTPDEVVRSSAIICTLTPSQAALFSDASVSNGAHINAVGAFRPSMCELPSATINRSRVYVDQLAAAKVEAGDLIQAENAGVFSWDDLKGEVGQVASGSCPGRTSDDDITVFKSVGVSLQDAAAARIALSNAARDGIGQVIDWP